MNLRDLPLASPEQQDSLQELLAARVLQEGFLSWQPAGEAAIIPRGPILLSHMLAPGAARALRDDYARRGLPDLSALHLWRAGRDLAEILKGNLPDAAGPAPSPVFAKTEFRGAKVADVGNFMGELARGRARLKPWQRDILAAFNVRSHAAPRLRDIQPGAVDEMARGYAGRSQEYAPAMFDPNCNTILMLGAHRIARVDPEAPVLFVRSKDVFFLYLHECGHALSTACREISEMPDLKKAYAEDIARLSRLPEGPAQEGHVMHLCINDDTGEVRQGKRKIWMSGTSWAQRKSVDYYLPENEGGTHTGPAAARSEAVAELFAIRMAGYQRPGHDLLAAFPATADALGRILDAIETDMARKPDLGRLLRPGWRALAPRPLPNGEIQRLREKAERGHTPAQSRLGDCYMWGDHLPRNPARAAFWYAVAAPKTGPKKRDIALSRLTPARAAQVAAAAAAWKPKIPAIAPPVGRPKLNDGIGRASAARDK